MSDFVKYMSAEVDPADSSANTTSRGASTTASGAVGSGYASHHHDSASATYQSESGYATEARSGLAHSQYGYGSSHAAGTYTGSDDTFASGTTSTTEKLASYIPGTQANEDSRVAGRHDYGSSGYDATSSTYGSSHHAATGTGDGYVGGTVGETIASYIPGTQANIAAKEAAVDDHYGSTGRDYTSSSSGYGSTHQAPKGSGEGYIGGTTGETIASYIPGTQANATSKAIASDGYGSQDAYNRTGTHTAPASSGVLGGIASAIPGTEAYEETHGTTSAHAGRDPITRGYSSSAPASDEYTTSSTRGQGYSEKYPGGDTYASGGGLGTTAASYIPGTQAHADSNAHSTYRGEEYQYNAPAYPSGVSEYNTAAYPSGISQYESSGYPSGVSHYENGVTTYAAANPLVISTGTAGAYLPPVTHSTAPVYGTTEASAVPLHAETATTSLPIRSAAAAAVVPVVPVPVQEPRKSVAEPAQRRESEAEPSKSKMTPAQRARGGLTEFDRDEAIINSVLNEPIHRHGAPKLNPAKDESTQKSTESPSHGKKHVNVATDESTQKSNESHRSGGVVNPAVDDSTEAMKARTGSAPSRDLGSASNAAMEGGEVPRRH